MDEFIKQVNPIELFKTKDEVRNWIINNPEELERAVGKELCCTRYFTEAPSDMRPDIYTEEKQTAYRIAVMITLEKTTDSDLAKFITISSFNDVKRAIWIVSDIDNRTRFMIDWLNDVIQGNVEFIIVKLGVYRLDNSRLVAQLERLEKLRVANDYQEYL